MGAGGGYGWWGRADDGVSVVGEVMGGGEILDFKEIWRRGTEEKCTATGERLGERGKSVT
jgi:hypothetical protein